VARASEAFSTVVWENPTVRADVEVPLDPPRVGTEDVGVSLSVSQTIRPGDFGVRQIVADLIKKEGSIDNVLAFRAFTQELLTRYAALWEAQEKEEVFGRAHSRAEQLLRRLSSASRGLVSSGDLELLHASVTSFQAEQMAAHAEGLRIRSDWARSLGYVIPAGRVRTPAAKLAVDWNAVTRAINDNVLSVQQRAMLRSELATARSSLASKESSPAWSPSVGFGRHDDGTSQVLVGLSVPLPTYNRNQGAISQLGAEARAAEKEALSVKGDTILASIRALYDGLVELERLVRLYRDQVIPAKERAIAAYDKQFDAGLGSGFQSWQAQKDLVETQLRAIGVLVQLTVGQGELEQLVGQ
jgi:hypothetical protein